MKLYDALRNDSELRDDLLAVIDGERNRVHVELDLLDASDFDGLRNLKARLDALRQLRFVFLKEERTSRAHAARPH